jgi:putative ABC transport system substrate-binding protein
MKQFDTLIAKKSYIFVGLLVVLLGLFIAFTYTHKKVLSNKVYRVGITQPISHPGIDIVRDGIVAGFAAKGYTNGKNIYFDFQNSQGDASTGQAIAQKFANSDYDIFMPIGTGSSQSLVNLIKSRPIVFAAVTDPVSAGIVKSKENPGANVTGTSDMVMFKEQLSLLKRLAPNAKKVGVINNPSESNSQFGLKETQKIANEMGLEIVTASVSNTDEVLGAANSLVSKVDAFYIISDNTVIAGQDAVIKVALDSKKPLIAVEEAGVEKGALGTVGISYYKLGILTANIALEILQGKKPSETPVYSAKDGDLFINTKTAQAIGVTVPSDLLKQAKKIYN